MLDHKLYQKFEIQSRINPDISDATGDQEMPDEENEEIIQNVFQGNVPYRDVSLTPVHPTIVSENQESEATEESKMYSTINHMESVFSLKLMAKHNLSQEVVNDIFCYTDDIHSMKVNAINHQLKRKFDDDEVSISTGMVL